MSEDQIDDETIEFCKNLEIHLQGTDSIKKTAIIMAIISARLGTMAGLKKDQLTKLMEAGVSTAEQGIPCETVLISMKDSPAVLIQKGMGTQSQELALKTLDTFFEEAEKRNISKSGAADSIAYIVATFCRALEIPLSEIVGRLGMASFLVREQEKQEESSKKAMPVLKLN